ncbi:unnamed protein product [Caenorhabditis sp. 36 PRJEB53466]|nr:unnamed protein product [Caenorhabditis sp. 36 PRJEB53466]
MKRISDCCDVSPPGKQHILTSNMSNRGSLNESLIMDHDQISADYDFVTKALLVQKRSSKNDNLNTSRIITSCQKSSVSLSYFFEEYGNIPLPIWMTAALIRDMAKALLQLHNNQVVHGAVTPENIHFMKEKPWICLLTSRAHARKINPHKIMKSRAEDIAQLGHVLFRCLTGWEVGTVDLTGRPFEIPENGLVLASKMMARKFSEPVQYIMTHPFVVENCKLRTARFLKLTSLQ